jgi:copper chaperone
MACRTLTVTGMSCTGCEDTVETALSELDGVTSVDADHEGDSVDIVAEDSVSDAAVRAAVEDAGYEVGA